MEIAISAIGTANPAYKRHQLETADLITAGVNLKPAEKRLLKSVYKATGIEYRHSVLSDYCKSPGDFDFFPNDPEAEYPSTAARMQIYKEHALPLAIAAIKNCLEEHDLNQITHLITVSCTGMYAPGMDIEIVQQLQLNTTTKRTVVNFMGCYGAFNGMKLAHAICKADPTAKVIVVCVELCTIHFQKDMRLDNIMSNSIFADGAAAILVEANPQVKKYFIFEDFYCDLLPQTNQEMAWHVGNSGFDIVLSSYVPEVIQSGIAKFVEKLLTQSALTFSDIDLFAIHPGGIKILEACEEALDITKENNKYSYEILKNYGNMSSATILFVLKALFDDVTSHEHNKKVFSCAFGPGLTLESMLLKVNYNL